MPFFDIFAARTRRQLMTVEAPDITTAAMRAVQAAPHCDGLAPLEGNIVARPRNENTVCSVAFFADGWFRWQADLAAAQSGAAS